MAKNEQRLNAVMTAARSAEMGIPAKTRYARIKASCRMILSLLFSGNRCSKQPINAQTSERCAPDTAITCAKPQTLKLWYASSERFLR